MDISRTLMKVGVIALGVLLLVGVIYGAIQKQAYESQLRELRNAVASRDKTIETQQGVYHKLTLEMTDLRGTLDSKDEEIKRLNDELKKNKEQLLTATSLVVKWKKAYEAAVAGNQTEVPGENGTVRKKVEFAKDFGYIGVNGWTLTDPAEAWIKVEQLRPLKLSMTISQDKDGAWHTRTTSSEENVGVDIAVTAVNPYLLDPKWYEGIGVKLDLAGGSTNAGFGFLAGAGVTYRIKQFEVGPSVWVAISDRVDKYFGGTLVWHPFQKR